VNADLRKKPLSRDHVLATVVKLLEKTHIRIGNREYARSNNRSASPHCATIT
jgi:DNA topoisomerase-1